MLDLVQRHLNEASSFTNIVYAALLIFLIGVLDYLVGSEINLSIFYVIPLSGVAWYSGRRSAYIVCAIALTVWFIADYVNFPTYSHWLIRYWNALVRLPFLLIIVLLVLRIKEALLNEKSLARNDNLTGLLNGRGFYEVGGYEIDRSARNGLAFSMAYLDLDNFKKVNDTYGHSTGDVLLREVGSIMKNSLRKIDYVARLGGDEFGILLPEAGTNAAKTAIQKIQESLLKKMQEKNWPVTMSIGVLTFETPPVSVSAMIQIADKLMYSVKNSGKNNAAYRVYKAEIIEP
jgi:diguanylate cyclase (GGDEF)-like protein